MITKKIISNSDVWLEGKAIDQFNKTAELPNIKHAVAFPDLHPGKGIPIGASFVSEDMIYPHLIGNDIGCGIGLWQTNLKVHKLKIDKAFKKFTKFDKIEIDSNNAKNLLKSKNLATNFFSNALGTIGSGNHFLELTKFEEICDEKIFKELNLNKQNALILVHCGSRSLGSVVLRKYTDKFGGLGATIDSIPAQNYLEEHNQACDWATINRQLIAEKTMKILNCKGKLITDSMHNILKQYHENLWIHRKGATDILTNQIAVIAGSRGTFSYLVRAKNANIETAFSIAHGAGRKWQRSEVKQRLSAKYKVIDLQKTALKSRVICEDRQLLYEEAPQAYKKIDNVIKALKDANLITVIAKLRPIITYKKGVEKYDSK